MQTQHDGKSIPWSVYDDAARIAWENAEIERWWDEIPPDRYGNRWSGAALRPAPRFGLTANGR